jgi:3-hydroxyisobutyrate dehydrogenase-like beta-hydroxyacid dehydrogenase
VGVVGIAGFGVVGTELAAELSDAQVRVFDARGKAARTERPVFTDPAAFCAGLDIVFLAVPGRVALEVTRLLVPAARAGLVFADMTAKPVSVRDRVAELCEEAGLRYADTAIVDPVGPSSRRMSLLASGPGAAAVAESLAGTRFVTTVADGRRPMSTEAKLCRSVFTKGLASLLLETIVVARRAGLTEHVLPAIEASMETEFSKVVDILVGSSLRHAVRRSAELEAVEEFVRRYLGKPRMTAATREVFSRLAAASDGGADGEEMAVVSAAVDAAGVFD